MLRELALHEIGKARDTLIELAVTVILLQGALFVSPCLHLFLLLLVSRGCSRRRLNLSIYHYRRLLGHTFIFFLFICHTTLQTLHVHLLKQARRGTALAHEFRHGRLLGLFTLLFLIVVVILLSISLIAIISVSLLLNGCKRVKFLMKRAQCDRVLSLDLNAARPHVVGLATTLCLL